MIVVPANSLAPAKAWGGNPGGAGMDARFRGHDVRRDFHAEKVYRRFMVAVRLVLNLLE
jgi:hypothetical protein